MINFLSYVYFTLFIKWKTGNQLKICLVHLLADENANVAHSLVMVLDKNNFENISQKRSITKLIKDFQKRSNVDHFVLLAYDAAV